MLGPFLPLGMALIDFTLLEMKIGQERHLAHFSSLQALKIHEENAEGLSNFGL